MTTPGNGDDGERVDLGKHDGSSQASGEPDFDPYRFGRPEHPIAPEYAPPGYVPDTPTTSPASPAPGTYPPPPTYGQQAQHPQQQYPPSHYPQQQYPNPQYPGQQYQPPPYPSQQYQPYGQPGAHNFRAPSTGKATTALVLGIVSIVFCWLTFFDLVLIVPAVIFGIIGIVESKHQGGAGRGKAIAGLVCAAVSVILAIVILTVLFDAADNCGGFANGNDPGFSQCLRDNL